MLDNRDHQLLTTIQLGLPVCPRPYAQVGQRCAMSEEEVITRLTRLQQQGIIKRLGIIVKHHSLGYRANAMIVWDIPDELIQTIGTQISRFAFVTLCYQRPRQTEWPYNLYCMIHGKDRAVVRQQLEQLNQACGLITYAQDILFSRRCFKQRGAWYPTQPAPVNPHG